MERLRIIFPSSTASFLSPLCEEDTIHLLTEHMGGDEFAPWKMTPTGDPGMYYAD